MEQRICIVSPFITALFSVKDWLANIFPITIKDHSMLTAHTGNNIPARGLQGEGKFE